MPSLISVIIPVKEITDYLRHENMPAMSEQTYKNFEVIVLPNKLSGEDKTLLLKYPWLRIIPTGKITRPAQKETWASKMRAEILSHSSTMMPTPKKTG